MMVLFDNELIKNVEIDEIYEPFINLNKINHKIIVDNSMSQIANKSPYFCYCRKTVAELLIQSVDFLPTGILYYIKEAYRPLETQRKSFENVYKSYKEKYRKLDENELLKRVYEYVAPIDVAPHPTGGAIDLVLINENGENIEMGTEYNAEPIETKNKTYTNNEFLTKEEKRNRKILINSLETVGFVNYPSEWWHWSYGDKYWGFLKGKKALYNQITENKITQI